MFAFPRRGFTLTVKFLYILVLSPIAHISAFHLLPNADFPSCWNRTVQFLDPSNYNDSRQIWLWDRTHTIRTNSHPLASLAFCESACGDGYQLWEWDDTVLRITMWVFPAIVLLVHFHFAPLGVGNICAIIMHLLGDPLDTLWSMMTRQEINRRFYRRAKNYSGTNEFRHIATVWSAFDELGWRDPSSHFANTLRRRSDPDTSNSDESTSNSDESTSNSDESRGPNEGIQKTEGIFNRIVALINSKKSSQGGYHYLPIREDQGLTKAELYHIQVASHRLASNRSESQLTTWFAIIGLGGALAAAFIRTYMQKLNNQTAHTIAVVALFFILIPIVKISGNMGSFTSTSIAIDIIQDLRRNLRILKPKGPQLFPPLELDHRFGWDYSRRPEGDEEMAEVKGRICGVEYRDLEAWPKMAPWAGMNNSWRPCKTMLIEDYFSTSNRSRSSLFVLAFLFVMSSYSPALILSYKTPTVGFSCRSMAWTLVLIAWTVSAAFDQLLKWRIASAKNLWTATLVKDFFIMTFFVIVIITAQVGYFNSCWCRSGVLDAGTAAYVDLAPQSRDDWVDGWPLWTITPLSFGIFIMILIFTVGQDGDNARTLLSRSESERQGDLLVLEGLRKDLEDESHFPSSVPTGRLGADIFDRQFRPQTDSATVVEEERHDVATY
jgi:hypothetical protein